MPAHSLRTASADLEPQPYRWGLFPTATFYSRLPELGGLTLWLMLRVSPCARPAVFTFSVSHPAQPSDNQRLEHGRLLSQLSGCHLIASYAARCGCLAVDGVNYTRLARHCQYPATTCRSSADTRSRRAHGREAITGGNHTAPPAVSRPRSATSYGWLLIRI